MTPVATTLNGQPMASDDVSSFATSSKIKLDPLDPFQPSHLQTNPTPASPPTKASASATGKQRWVPTKHLEAPAPPSSDPKMLEEMVAQQSAQALGYEGRRIKKFMQRRTVDYWGTVSRWNYRRLTRTTVRGEESLCVGVYPTPNQVIHMLPPAAYSNSSTSIASTLVHTSTNKIRCPVNVVRWTPEGRRLLTGSTSGEFTLWNGLTFNFETIMQAHDSAIRAFEWSRSGTWLISADQNGAIKYFHSNLNNLQAFQGHREAIRALSFSPDDQRFVSASDDSTIKVWGFDEAREEKTLSGHGWDVKCLDWHKTKGIIVSGSKDNLVKFWDPRSNTTLGTFHGHKNTVQACKWSPDGNLVATASRDQVIKIYDIRAMSDIYTLKGHNKEACSVDWHPVHHDLLISGGSEGSILYWSLNSETPEVPVHSMDEAHESNVWSLQWHPFGHILCSGSNDHTTRFWSRSRPGDGLSLETESESRNKWVAKHGTDWEDETIPGFTSQQPLKSFIPSISSSTDPSGRLQQQPLAPENTTTTLTTATSFLDESEDIMIPGLSFSSSNVNNRSSFPPPPPPPQPSSYSHFNNNRQQQQQQPVGGAYGSFYPSHSNPPPPPGTTPSTRWSQQQQQQQHGPPPSKRW